MIWRFFVTAAVVLGVLWICSMLGGCATANWSAGVATDEIDFKQGPNVVPKATFSIGGTF